MSGFWQTGDSSTDTSDSDFSSDDLQTGPTQASSYFLRSDDSSSEEESRQAKSKKASRFEELKEIIAKIQDASEAEEFQVALKEYENLYKALQKSKNVFNRIGKVPSFVISALVDLTDTVDESFGNRKSLSKLDAKALTALKQKLKKQNGPYEDRMEQYRKEPIDSSSSEEEAEDEDESDDDDEPKEKVIKVTDILEKKRPVLFEEKQKITQELVLEKLKELTLLRGKKTTVAEEYIDDLKQLIEIVQEKELGKALEAKIYSFIIVAQSENYQRTGNMISKETWALVKDGVHKMLASHNEDGIKMDPNITEEQEVFSQPEGVSEPVQLLIKVDLFFYVEKLDEQLTRSLVNSDPHTTEFSSRLKDDLELYKLVLAIKPIVEELNVVDNICRLYTFIIMKIYYKPLAVLKKIDEILGRVYDNDYFVNLCKYIYKHDKKGLFRARGILCQIYSLSLNDKWYEARDLLLMSHLQESIGHSDVQTQILFNRTMVQLGLCAFRSGRIHEAHSCLQDISSSGRAKELLSQGFISQKYQDKSQEQIAIEKLRQLPFHMHINLELIECVCLTCAMLLEIPNMAANVYDHKRRVISKQFRRLMDFNDRQIFSGPPENTREHIVAASRAMANGEWKKACDVLFDIKVWELLSNKDHIKEMLVEKMQEQGVRTYLFTFGCIYESICVAELSALFDMKQSRIQNLVSKMMLTEELKATWDQDTNFIVMHKNDPTKLQHLAKQFAEKGAILVENNERFMDMQTGKYGYKDSIRSKTLYFDHNNHYKYRNGDKGRRGGNRGRRGDRSGMRGNRNGRNNRRSDNNKDNVDKLSGDKKDQENVKKRVLKAEE